MMSEDDLMDEDIMNVTDTSGFDPDRLRRELQDARVLFPDRSAATPPSKRPDWWDEPSKYSLRTVSATTSTMAEKNDLVHQYHNLIASDHNNNRHNANTRRGLESVFAPNIDWQRAAHLLSAKLESTTERAEHAERENMLMVTQMQRLEQIITANAAASMKRKGAEIGCQTALSVQELGQMELTVAEMIPQLAEERRAASEQAEKSHELLQQLNQACEHIEQCDDQMISLHQTVAELQGAARAAANEQQHLVDLKQTVEQLKLVNAELQNDLDASRASLRSINEELCQSNMRMITAEKALKREKKRALRAQQKETAADLRNQRKDARPAEASVQAQESTECGTGDTTAAEGEPGWFKGSLR